MKKNRLIAYVIGGTGALAVISGLFLLPSSKPMTLSAAITLICLSLASGLLAPNPVSFIGLIAGICMLIFPSPIVGIILIILGIIVAVTNLFISKRQLKLIAQ